MNRFLEIQQRLAIRELIPDRHTNPISSKMEGGTGGAGSAPVGHDRRACLTSILCAFNVPPCAAENFRRKESNRRPISRPEGKMNGAMVLISQSIVPPVERVSQRVQNSNR